jgi:hypothetical protein
VTSDVIRRYPIAIPIPITVAITVAIPIPITVAITVAIAVAMPIPITVAIAVAMHLFPLRQTLNLKD